MIRLERVDRFDAFEALREPWNDLARRDGPPLPYKRHEWLAAWWLGFGARAALSVLIAREGGSIAAAAPLMRSRRTLAGVPVRALHTLGLNVGFSDLLCDPDRPEALEILLDAATRDKGADVLLVRGTLAGEAKEARMRHWIRSAGFACDTTPCGEYWLDARGGVPGYLAGRPPRLLENAAKRARALGRVGDVRYERVRGSGPWEQPLEDAFDVSLRSWKARRGSAVGQMDSFRRFLRELLRRFGRTDEAELCLLRIGGRPIAFRIGSSDDGVFVDQEIAFDEEWRRYSPGTLVALHSDQALIRSGVSEINLGMDYPWKESWAPIHRERVEWVVYRPWTARGNLARVARVVRGRLRRGARGRDRAHGTSTGPAR